MWWCRLTVQLLESIHSLRDDHLDLAYVMLVAANVLSALLLAGSDGFYSYSGGHLFRCADLMSSGSDDEVTMMYFVFMIVPLALRLIFFTSRPSFLELAVFFGIFGFGLLFVAVASDCGDLVSTGFVRGSVSANIFMATGLLSAIELIWLHVRR